MSVTTGIRRDDSAMIAPLRADTACSGACAGSVKPALRDGAAGTGTACDGSVAALVLRCGATGSGPLRDASLLIAPLRGRAAGTGTARDGSVAATGTPR